MRYRTFPIKTVARLASLLAVIAATVNIVRADEPQPALEAERLTEAVDKLAQRVVKFIESKDEQKRLYLGPVTGPGGGGARVNLELQRQLTERGLNLRDFDTNVYSLKGDFAHGEKGGRPITKLSLRFYDPSGEQVNKATEEVFGKQAVQLASDVLTNPDEGALKAEVADFNDFLALGGARSGAADLRDPNNAGHGLTEKDKILDGLKALAGPVLPEAIPNTVAFAADAKVGVGILLNNGKGYEPCPFNPDDLAQGVARVQFSEGQVFAIAIDNKFEDRPIGAAVFVDGINIFEFSQVEPWRRGGTMLLRPGRNMILGWNHDREWSHEFRAGNYADSAAAQLNPGVTDNVGTITVVFYDVLSAKGTDPLAVGLGGPVQAPYRAAHALFGPQFGVVRIQFSRSVHPQDLPPG